QGKAIGLDIAAAKLKFSLATQPAAMERLRALLNEGVSILAGFRPNDFPATTAWREKVRTALAELQRSEADTRCNFYFVGLDVGKRCKLKKDPEEGHLWKGSEG